MKLMMTSPSSSSAMMLMGKSCFAVMSSLQSSQPQIISALLTLSICFVILMMVVMMIMIIIFTLSICFVIHMMLWMIVILMWTMMMLLMISIIIMIISFTMTDAPSSSQAPIWCLRARRSKSGHWAKKGEEKSFNRSQSWPSIAVILPCLLSHIAFFNFLTFPLPHCLF